MSKMLKEIDVKDKINCIQGSTTIERVAMKKDHSENRVEYTQASGNGRVPIFGNRIWEYDIVCSIWKHIEGIEVAFYIVTNRIFC